MGTMMGKFSGFFSGRLIAGLLFLFAVFAWLPAAHAASGITSMRIGQGVGSVRIVLDADKNFDYKAFILNNPKRLVIDTFDINVSPRLENYRDKNNLVDKTRLGSVGTDGTRIVFDLKSRRLSKRRLCCRRSRLSAGVLSLTWLWRLNASLPRNSVPTTLFPAIPRRLR